MKTVAVPSAVPVGVASMAHITSGRSGMIVPLCAAEPCGWPVLVGASRLASRSSRSTRGFAGPDPGQTQACLDLVISLTNEGRARQDATDLVGQLGSVNTVFGPRFRGR